MERLDGFAFDDVESMHAAGIDTHALLQAGLIASLEGAMIYGVFHGDLHGGNLVVQPDGRTALFDFGMTGRLSETQRVAFMRLLMFGTTGDQRGQLVALRDLGAFPPDVDLDALARDLDLDGPVKDPTQMSADALMAEMREVTKKLLGYGARVPKELMLFVKNTMFLNSATAILAPDLDMLQQMMTIYTYFAETHGERILREVGIDASQAAPDPDAMKAAFLVDSDTDSLTYRDLQARRDEVRHKLQRQRERKRRRAALVARQGGAEVPELPQMQALAERLGDALTGKVLEGVEPLGFSALKTVVPAPETLIGRPVERVDRRAQVPHPRLRRVGPHPPPPLAGRPARPRGPAQEDPGQGLGGAAALRRRARGARARVRARAQGRVVGARPRRRRAARATRARARLRRVRRDHPPRCRRPPRAHAAARPTHGVGRRARLRRRRACGARSCRRTRR